MGSHCILAKSGRGLGADATTCILSFLPNLVPWIESCFHCVRNQCPFTVCVISAQKEHPRSGKRHPVYFCDLGCSYITSPGDSIADGFFFKFNHKNY